MTLSPSQIAKREISIYRETSDLSGGVGSRTRNLLANIHTRPEFPQYRYCPLPAYAHAEARRIALRRLSGFVAKQSGAFRSERGSGRVTLSLVPSSRIMIYQSVRPYNVPLFYSIAERVVRLSQEFFNAQYLIAAIQIVSSGQKLSTSRSFLSPTSFELIVRL